MSRIFSSRRATTAYAKITSQDTPSAAPQRTSRTVLLRIVTLMLFGGLVASLLLLVSRDGNFGAASSPKPVSGGSVVDGLSLEPDSLLPNHYQVWAPAPVVGSALWASLWYFDSQGILHPGIATEVPTPTGLKTIIFHLRPGLKWSDGTPETADDCVFSFNLYANPAYGNTFGFPTTDPSDPVGFESATKVDTWTVRLTFKHPRVGMLYALVDSPGTCLQKAHYSTIAPADFATSSENTQPQVTNGPFKFKEWVHGDHITLVRNPYYFQGPDKPYLDQITFKFITDPARMLAALQSHLVDTSWGLDFNQLAALRAIPGYTTYLDRYPQGVEYLLFNLADPILADHAVRQALTTSFNITQLPQQLYGGAAQPTCDGATGTFAHEPSLVPCYRYDPHAAGQLLEADGWAMGADGYRHKNGQTLELTYLTNAFLSRKVTQALAKADWQEVGIKVDVQNSGDFQSAYCQGRFQIGEVHDNGGFDPDDSWIFASDQTCDKGGYNDMHYASPIVDQEESIQLSTDDISARKAAFHIIHEQVLKDLPVMYLYSQAGIGCAISALHHYDPADPVGGPGDTWNVWDWYLSATP